MNTWGLNGEDENPIFSDVGSDQPDQHWYNDTSQNEINVNIPEEDHETTEFKENANDVRSMEVEMNWGAN